MGTALNDPNLVIQTFYKTQRDFILRVDKGGDPIPMAFDHLCKLLIWLEPLPLQGRSPVIEEFSSPALFLILPKLAEEFLQETGVVVEPI
jgi:hypothetical protein